MKDMKRHSASVSRSLLRFDWAAKTVLREKENHDILEGLLGVLFGEEVRIVELLEKARKAYDAYLYDMHYQQDVIAAYDQAGWERGREEGEKKGREQGEAIGLEKGEAIGLEKGQEIGRKEGGREKAQSIAWQLKQMGLSDMQILQATGLSAGELEAVLSGSGS